ncbi:MAG: hypothetical protein M3119_00730 [Verrucomicrobiota bacterium]|nr:hypothetical protein [Verrucomicrobiota bacterium]
MRSRLLMIVAWIACATLSLAADQKKGLRNGAYYEFRGHLYDRSTIAHNFTLYWSAGSQPIVVTGETRIYRKGQRAGLESVKSGDAVCGVGLARNGRLIAIAVAFGDDGVELPSSAKVPASITLPNNTGD